MNLREAIQRAMHKPVTGEAVVLAKVLSVDSAQFTIDVEPLNGDADIFDVRLNAVPGSEEGFIMLPSVGSIVGIIMVNESTGFVGLYSQIDSVQFNGGVYGGLIKIEELVSKLNAIESDINSLKQAFSSWVPVPNDGGAALKASAGTWFGQQLIETQKSGLENPNIKHG
jgi:hypothetical protein